VCGPGEICVGGACVPQNATGCAGGCPPSSPDPLDVRSWCCAGQCKDLTSDLDNCGRCGARCATGKRPTCCEGYCRDTASDPRHCGGCFKPCRTEGICHAGKCLDECPAPLRQCGKTCYRPQTELCCNGKVVAKDDLQHDRDHCSPRRDRCGTRCPPGQICEGGRCVTPCPAGQTRCGGRCADTTSDPANCGADCAVCNTTLAPACCGGTCTNLGLNDEHCGACFNKCKPGEFCRFGECVCPLGMTCG
jgi:hypothetical protein